MTQNKSSYTKTKIHNITRYDWEKSSIIDTKSFSSMSDIRGLIWKLAEFQRS